MKQKRRGRRERERETSAIDKRRKRGLGSEGGK
jgi:hypothetical protein